MRPLKLIISAFGPYAKEEVIDFQLLNGKNIFLITGSTGAGKTTIFDAISYALFGEASGSARENDSLRSDFSAADRLTFVELDFELRGQKYHIRRIPQQLKPKVKGEGFTTQSSEAELILPDGKVKTGNNNVSNKINELLGINKEQFKQIVMLPQGEFKKLLLADSKEREIIFRKIFGTYTYEKIQTLLYDRARIIYKELESSKERVKAYVKNVRCEEKIDVGDYVEFDAIIQILEKLIKESKAKYDETQKRLNRVKKEIDRFSEEKINGQNINKLIEEKNNTKATLEKMTNEKEFIKEKEILWDKLNRAREITYIEEELLKQINNKEIKITDNIECNNAIIDIKEKLDEAKNSLKVEENREEERSKLSEQINSLSEKRPKIIEFDNKINNINDLSIKLKKNIELTKKEKESIEFLKIEKKEKENLIKEISEFEKRKIILEKDIEENNKKIQEVRDLYKGITKFKELNKIHEELSVKFLSKEQVYIEKKKEFEEKEELYMKEQAGILAMKLVDESPCPVCGSVKHPNPAKRLNNVPTEDELEASKKIFEFHQKEYNESLLELTKIRSSADNLLDEVINKKLYNLSEVIECSKSFNEYTEEKVLVSGKSIGNKINELKEEVEAINKEISKKESINFRLVKIDEELKVKEKLLEDINSEHTTIYGSLKGEEETLKSLESDLPKDIKSITELDDRINKLKDKLNKYNEQLKLALESVNKYNNELTSKETKAKGIEKIIKELEEEIQTKKSLLEEKIQTCGFNNYEDYKSITNLIGKEEVLKSEINKFNEEFKSIRDKFIELQDKTKDMEVIDINEIEESIKKLRLIENDVYNEEKEIYSITTNNSNVLKEIKEIKYKFEDRESRYKTIGELATLASGKKSPYVTFERFVLASYFQEIIDAANLRLSKMTGDRFALKRKEDKGKGSYQQGLELEVYDNYTGKCRHVKTLSGGESFKASLSLALGLSDVVQTNAGGISLDTIFIDEGFGTLDSESLDNAINSLIELQRGGRLVGIISHVPELKERIESKLEITISATGSSANFSVN
ncbi:MULTISPECIES: AAA family ATPase [Clostridium]|uniref:Nuclease SbcCD subunit C n=1 Tax=Clostridium cibarium TaxID=2762247 RepID=A0ABR8PRR7_9CLOT|nr:MULTISPECIES: AAA family ATPase [Clostridium]MBD7910857.1 AAA family ATPase [Clostridium cibarium]